MAICSQPPPRAVATTRSTLSKESSELTAENSSQALKVFLNLKLEVLGPEIFACKKNQKCGKDYTTNAFP